MTITTNRNKYQWQFPIRLKLMHGDDGYYVVTSFHPPLVAIEPLEDDLSLSKILIAFSDD